MEIYERRELKSMTSQSAAKADPKHVARYADMFSAMGTEPRLRIMQLLLSAHPKGLVVGDIQEQVDIPKSTLSHHLEKLRPKILSMCDARAHFCVTRQIQKHYRNCSVSCMPNAARETRRWMPERSSKFADRCPLRGELAMSGPQITNGSNIREVVKEKYGEAARRVKAGGSSCCGATAASGCCDPITSNLYGAPQTNDIPEEALLASLGCGNPTALAKLNPGEIVLDLGSGGGIDVLLSAKPWGQPAKLLALT